MTEKTDSDNGDYLGYGVYAETLWNRVQAALDKDKGDPDKLGDDPLVVGIFGEWGAGKSTLLKLVQRRAEQAAQEAAAAQQNVLTVPVYFQPWKYEHEKHLLVPLVLHVVEATRQALKKSPTVGQQLAVLSKEADQAANKAATVVHTSVKTARKWFPVLKKVVGSLSVFGVSIALPDEIDDWLKDAEAVFASPEAKEQQRKATARELRAKKLSFVDNGFHYYDLHELLTSLTRPGKTEHAEDLTAQGASPDDLRINFVIFIDDLDRCLPEKAVETLELIKTVFNLESFAFVLALDEEVVERGIGHRYSAYTLAGKKPEMPITGFEYLEKIVHLPFRLPALSRGQAADMLRTYESKVLAPGQPHLWWFAAQPKSVTDQSAQATGFEKGNRHLGAESISGANPADRGERGADMELLPLVLESFDAYVPRKLIRLVELLHQIAAVMRERQRPLSWKPGAFKDENAVDVRVVLALLMLQLFQPELYRLMRRRASAFPALLSAFASAQKEQKQALGTATLADLDLYRWCACESEMPGGDLLARIQAIDDPTTKALAQQVRLPMVELLVQYRAAQRHPFDALKLMQALARSMDQTQSGPEWVTASSYWGLLATSVVSLSVNAMFDDGMELSVELDTQPGKTIARDSRPVARSVSAQKLFEELASSQTAVQANLAQSNGLEAGAVLPPDVAAQLLTLCSQASKDQKQRIAEGLSYLAPYLARADGPLFAPFAAPAPEDLFARSAPFDNKVQLAQAVAAADLQSALRVDNRFNSQRFHLPRHKFNGSAGSEEPVVGFVRVPKGTLTLGAKGPGFENNPTKRGARIDSDYYIARYLTTVDQYARFVEAGGYGDPAGKNPGCWDALGWLWRTGQWDSQIKEEAYRERLASRKPELRGAPMSWAEQQAHGSRPVMRLNWFEARAYANWLTGQLQAELNSLPTGYAVRLPTEAQWERAARARDTLSTDTRQYPWDGAEQTAHLHANIRASDIGRPSPVGLFAPSPLGLCDLSGNLWEWQNNLYRPDGSGQDIGKNLDIDALKTHWDPDQGDLPALRGGSWGDAAGGARASFRSRDLPVDWDDLVGFRVVLSLAI